MYPCIDMHTNTIKNYKKYMLHIKMTILLYIHIYIKTVMKLLLFIIINRLMNLIGHPIMTTQLNRRMKSSMTSIQTSKILIQSKTVKMKYMCYMTSDMAKTRHQ